MKFKDVFFNKSYRFLSQYKKNVIDRKIFDDFLYLAPHNKSRFSNKLLKKSTANSIYKDVASYFKLNDNSFFIKYSDDVKAKFDLNLNAQINKNGIDNFFNYFKINDFKDDNNENFKRIENILVHIRNSIAHDNLYIKSLNKIIYVLIYDEDLTKQYTAICCIKYIDLIKFHNLIM